MTDKPTPEAPPPTEDKPVAPAPQAQSQERKLRRSEVEDATARTIAAWMRGQALALAATPLPPDSIALAIHAASVQSVLLIAAGIEAGNWRPEASQPVAGSA